MEYVVLNNGVKMPILGYHVYAFDQIQCENCVEKALNIGYRLIDTAQAYQNEQAVGNAIAKSGVPRNEIFLTTKVWISNAGYEKAKKSIGDSLERLQTAYVDLLLIHHPFSDYYGIWKALEEAYQNKQARAIGVSNFYPDRLVDIASYSRVVPAVNQIEVNVFQQQSAIREVAKQYGVQIEAWAPFAEGRNGMFTNKTLEDIGSKHQKTVAQVVLRYLIQLGIVVIPKTYRVERMVENFNVFDFKLDSEDMQRIEKLDRKESVVFNFYDPKTVEMFVKMTDVIQIY